MRERLALGGAVAAALASGLCCVGPLLFALLGLGTFGAAAAFGAARPYLLAAAVLLLALGLYRAYARRDETCAPGGACASKPAGRAGLWIAALAVLALALSPYYAGYVAAALAGQGQPVTTAPAAAPAAGGESSRTGLETVIVKVEGMDCARCEAPIRAALESVPGVRSADVSYRRGDARVNFDPRQTDVNQIKRAVGSTGYKVR